jgi:hypothetical protein
VEAPPDEVIAYLLDGAAYAYPAQIIGQRMLQNARGESNNQDQKCARGTNTTELFGEKCPHELGMRSLAEFGAHEDSTNIRHALQHCARVERVESNHHQCGPPQKGKFGRRPATDYGRPVLRRFRTSARPRTFTRTWMGRAFSFSRLFFFSFGFLFLDFSTSTTTRVEPCFL